MDIVKKNIVSILCGVVALAGVIAWFFPVGGMFEQLQADLEKRAQVYKEVEAIRTAPRQMPTVVLEEAEPEKLGRFPNEKVIEVGRQATGAMIAQSELMLGTVTKLNVHEPLVPGSLPQPVAGNTPFDFIDAYLVEVGMGPDGWKAGLPAEMKATMPPTVEEMNAIAQEVWDEKYAIQVIDIGGQNNLEDVQRQFLEDMADLPQKERQKRAEAHMVYLSPEGVPASPEIVPGIPPTPEQIWFAQNVLWVQQDVAAAINAANEGADNVLRAPVKHLMSLSVPFGRDQYVTAGGAAKGGGDDGAAAVATDAQGRPAVFTASPTGRVCNDLYDVVHFNMVLRVDASRVPQVLEAIERNRLVTVLRTSLVAVDAAAEMRQFGYVYGDAPVVQLTLQCEALFLRSWTTNLMPDPVKEFLGAKAPEAAKDESAG